MTKITFGIIALNSQPFLEYNLKALYPFAHEIIVVEGATHAAKTLADAKGHSLDGSVSDVQDFIAGHDPEKKVQLVLAKDEGYEDGFWPEKDEMSYAYARRASGDWLWQVDSDEFYFKSDMEKIIAILEGDKPPSGISFPFIEFWGGFDYRTNGKWYIQEFTEVARVFRWGENFQYVTHRPPTVLDEDKKNLAEQNWISGKEMKSRGITMLHYSYVLPKQASQKVGYYSNVGWTDAFRDAGQWEQESYMKLSNPLFLGERGFPILQWLERFDGKHPKVILDLRKELNNKSPNEQRGNQDIEKLLGSFWYSFAVGMLKIVMPPYWAVRSFLKNRKKGHSPGMSVESNH